MPCIFQPKCKAKKYNIDNDKQAIDIKCNSHKIYLSILKIKSGVTFNHNNLLPAGIDEVEKLLQQLSSRKAFGKDKIPSALIIWFLQSLLVCQYQ